MIANAGKRFLSLMLALVMMVSLMPQVPLTVSAAGTLSLTVNGLTASWTDASNNSGNASWTGNGKTITGSATGYTTTPSCGDPTDEAITTTLTLTNTLTSDATLSFSYTLTGGGSVSDISGGAYEGVLAANGGKITITLTSPKGGSANTLTLSGISLVSTDAETVSTTFTTATNGSYTVNGTAVTAETVQEEAKYTLAATPASGYKFFGWKDSSGEYLSYDTPFNYVPSEETTITPVFIASNLAIFGVGAAKFYDLNTADAVASAGSTKTIILLNDGALPAGSHTVSKGNTLLVSFDDASLYTTEPALVNTDKTFNYTTVTYSAPKAVRTLTMENGANLSIQGAMSISNKVYASHSPDPHAGSPYGNCAFVTMNQGSSITIESGGTLYAWGFITGPGVKTGTSSGSGTVRAKSGATIYECFQVTDWRGGSDTGDMGNRVFPLSQYYVQNIEVPLTLEHGARELGYTAVHVTAMGGLGTPIDFIGTTNAMFSMGSGSVRKWYNGKTDRLIVEASGDLSISGVAMEVPGTGKTIKSADYNLGINNNITVQIKEDSTVSIDQDVAFYPGSEIIVEEGAVCTLASGTDVYVYDSTEWGGYVGTGNKQLIALEYAPGRSKKRTEADLEDAKVQVDGTIDATNGNIYTTASGANICTSGTGVIKMKAGTENTTYQYVYSGQYVPITVTSAQLYNKTTNEDGDGSYTQTTDAVAGDAFYWHAGEKKWVKAPFAITFKADTTEAAATDTQNVTVEQAVAGKYNLKANALVKEGHRFRNWTNADTTDTNTYADQAEVTFWKPTTLIANWDQEYPIIFTTDGTAVHYTVKAIKGEAVKAPTTDPTMDPTEGKVFNGWKDAAGNVVTFPYTVPETVTDAGITFTAKWANATSMVTFKDIEGDMIGEPVTGNFGDPFTVTAPEVEGHTFVGWYNGETKVETFPGEDMIVQAKYTPNPYTITFDPAGGSLTGDVGSTLSVVYGTAILTTQPLATRAGYEFKGWKITDADGTEYEASDSMPAKPLTATAQWEIKEYTITYNLNGGTATNPTTYTITSDAITLNNPTKPGYDFTGWTGSNGNTAETSVTIPAGSTENKAYTANWTLETYSITCDLAGGALAEGVTNPTTYTITSGAITLNNPTKIGHVFTGWTGSNGNTAETSVTIPAGSTGSRSYTANWELATYTIDYDLAGGTLAEGETNPTEYTYGDPTITLKNPTKPGYDFTGWTGSNGTTPSTEVTIVRYSTGNKTYTAHWDPIAYNITYRNSDNTDLVTDNKATYTIETDTFSLTAPSRAGYTFLGWTYGDVTKPTKTVTITKGSMGARTFIAHWEVVAYSITYDLVDGSWPDGENPNKTTYTVEDTFTLANPTKEGYTFAGWTGSNGTTAQTSVTVAKGTTDALTYTANWTHNTDTPYTVNHYWQNIDNDEYTLHKTEPKEGTTDAAVDAAKTYTGFTLKTPTEMVTIAGDGSTVVNYYYTRKSYTVALTAGTGIETVTGDGTYKYEEPVTISATVKAGYTWSGWTGTHTTSTQNYTFTMPAGDVTDTANAVAIPCNITYLLEDGSWPDGENPNQTTYTVEDTFTLTNPTKTGHTFLGWTYGDVTEPVKAVTIDEQTGALTFTAHWQATTYSITFHANDGSANPETSTQPVTYGEVVTLAENPFERQGYKFKEWQTKDGTSAYSDKQTISYTMDENLDLYAVWERDYVTYTVETYLMGTDGTYGAAASSTKTSALTGTPVTVTHETKEGFTPDTENANSVLSGTVAADGSLVLKVYYSRNQYTIKLDEAGGVEQDDITAYYEATVTLPENPSKTGYTFAGWQYKGKTVTEVTVPIGGATVTAQWTPAEVDYTVKTYTMDTNGEYSEIADETETRKAETESTVTVTPEEKPGFALDTEMSELSGTVAADGSLVLTVYYSRNQYTLTTKVDGVETVVGTYYYEAEITAPTVPTKTGYTFDGWTIISGGGGSYTEIPAKMPAENLTATAKWAAATVSYTVETYTMDTNGAYGEPETSNLSALTEEKVTAETNPATGFAVDTEKSVLSGTVAADGSLVLKVYYKRNPYTIKWVSGYDSTIYRTDTYLYGAAVTAVAPADPIRDNYGFTDWSGTPPTTMPAENLTIEAKWQADKNKITFITNGGEPIAAKEAAYGQVFTELPTPTRTGYIFTGWVDKDGEPVTASVTEPFVFTMSDEGLELTATWEAKQYTVTFNGNGGTAEEDATLTQQVIFNDETTLNANVFTLDGYDFDGWKTEDGKTKYTDRDAYTHTTDGNVTLYAVWKLKEYTITFHANDDSENPEKATQTVEHNVSEQLTGSFVREGYTLTGWKDADDTAYAVDAVVRLTQNVELYAVWEINQYSIKFYTDYDGTTFETVTADFKAGVAIPEVTEKVGYTFTGKWSSEKGGTEATVPEKMPARNDLVFYPLYTPKTYTIQYELVGGALKAGETNPDSYTIETDDITLNNPEKTGYSFAGWIESGGTAAQETVIIRKGSTGDKEFTAQWDPNDYTITFDANGGSGTMDAQTVEHNVAEALDANEFTAPEGYEFAGWATSADATTAQYADGAEITVTEGDTLYAVWTAKQYTITFDSKDGTPVGSITAAYQSPVSKPADPEKKGHDFSGWADAEGNAVTWPVSMPLDGTTLYATWTPKKYMITWIVGSDVSTTTVAYGQPPVYDGVPEKADTERYTYEFSGWYPELTPVTGTATYTAQFKEIERSYSISFETKFGSVETVTGTYGSQITLATLSQEGYTFGGWKTASGTTYTGTYTITGDQTLYAVWTVNEYDISFVDGSGGTIVPTKKLAFGADVAVPEGKPKKEGYVFKEWVWFKDENTVTSQLPTTMPAQPVTIMATWTAVKYTITFDANGGVFGDGSTTQETSQSYNDALNTPAEPTREGYTFDGWVWVKADDTEANVPDKVPAEAMTIKAAWKINTYTIRWDTDGDGSVDRIDANVAHGTDLTPPEISGKQTVSHVYTPNGWYPEVVPAAGDVTYTAQFMESRREYAITWVIDGAKETTNVAYGDLPTHAAPEKDTDAHYSYQFTGWKPEIVAVSGPATYTAQFDPTPVVYHIYLQDEDGSGIDTITAGYGKDTPEIKAPVKDGYTFTGWDGEIPVTMPAEDVYIKATWKINQYTITFDSDGGTDVVSITQDYNTAVTVPTEPVKTGYTFDGWEPALPTTMPLNGAALTAQWKINQYTITFNCAGGSSVDSITRDYNANLSDIEEPVPSRAGYTFTGWDKAIPDTMPAENITITASWSPNPYTITFYTEMDAVEPYAEINAVCDAPIALPEQPGKEGYNFGGWTDVDGNPVSIPETMPAGGLTLYAKWNIGTYSILFNTDGGTQVDPIEAEFGTDLTVFQVAEPSKEGYTFAGWEPEIPDTMPGSNMTVKAEWNINQYSIYFNTAGGSTVDTITQNYGTAVTAPEPPKKEGHTFAGWDGEIPGTMPAKDTTLTAQWTVNTYTINFITNGGSKVDPITALYGEAVTEPAAPTKTGYTFTGWDAEFPATMPAGLTLTAQWAAEKYAIDWDTDGDGDVDDTTEAEYDSLPTHADGEKAATAEYSYVFAGWTPELKVVDGAASYTATFTEVPNNYTITFDTSGGSEIETATYAYGAKVTAPAEPTRDGYTFDGWDALPETMPAKNVTVVAQWKANTYTIRFNTGEGSKVMSITASYGAPVSAPRNPSRTGYSFAGWDPAFPETMPLGGAALTAQWTINQYTITFDTDGGTEIPAITQDYGTAITAPADPTKEGYAFLGWSRTIPTNMPANNLTITAKWDYVYTGWKTDDKGTTYLIDGEIAYYAQWKNIEGNDYYFNTEGYVAKGVVMTNDPTDSYWASFVFDEETGIFQKDLTGIYTSGEDAYYVKNGEVVRYPGLVRIVKEDGEVNYYYFDANEKLVKDGTYEVTQNNDLLPADSYTFDENGVILHHEDTSRNGIDEEDGKKFYYIDGVKVYMGLVKIGEDHYYASTGGEVICGRSYWVTKTNNLMPQGMYAFDEEGRMIDEHDGDVNGDGDVTETDAIYLLWHTLFGDLYPVSVNADYNHDGTVTDADALLLLWHALFPDVYELCGKSAG